MFFTHFLTNLIPYYSELTGFSDAEICSTITSTIEACVSSRRLPALIVVESRARIADLALGLQKCPVSVIKCTTDTSPEDLRALQHKPSVLIGLSIQIAERISKKQLKRSWFKCIVLVELNEIVARGCRDHVQEVLKDGPEDTRLIITSGSPTIQNDLLSFKKYLKNVPCQQIRPQEELSLRRISSYFINYKHNGWKLKKLFELLKTTADEPTVIICNTRRTVEKLAEELQQCGIQANTLHADLDQKDRDDVVTMFIAGITQYLIATELAYNSVSKGIQNSLLINYDLPQSKEKYLAR